MRICYNCGAELSARERVPFKELCPKCDAYLHCCRNCRLYAPGAHNHCLSTTTEHVPDVERGNFCDEFEFRITEQPKEDRDRERVAPPPSDSRGKSARERFNDLFKK